MVLRGDNVDVFFCCFLFSAELVFSGDLVFFFLPLFVVARCLEFLVVKARHCKKENIFLALHRVKF